MAVKAKLLAHASAILRLLHVVRDAEPRACPTPPKVLDMVVTLVTFHAFTPVPVNLDGLQNVHIRDVTLLTFHPARSAFISLVPAKV